MLIESELWIQTVDGKKTDNLNFVIPPTKITFQNEQNYEEHKSSLEAFPKMD